MWQMVPIPTNQSSVVGVGMAKGEYVSFDGNQQVGGRIWELIQHGLASDDHDFGRPGNAGSGANDVFKLRSLHGGNVAATPKPRA